MQAQQESPFVDKIGARVLPRFLGAVDDPTLTEVDGTLLLGGYSADDDGIPAGATTLIQRGTLKTLAAMLSGIGITLFGICYHLATGELPKPYLVLLG